MSLAAAGACLPRRRGLTLSAPPATSAMKIQSGGNRNAVFAPFLARRPRNGGGSGLPVRRNGIVEEEASAARISGRHFNAATAGFYDSADFKWSVRSRNLLARRPRGRSAGRD